MTPIYHHYLDDVDGAERSSWGGEVHMGLLGNQVRIGLGVRDFEDSNDTLTVTLGVTDVPGLIYWTTR